MKYLVTREYNAIVKDKVIVEANSDEEMQFKLANSDFEFTDECEIQEDFSTMNILDSIPTGGESDQDVMKKMS